jgi:hypothetical protein
MLLTQNELEESIIALTCFFLAEKMRMNVLFDLMYFVRQF